MKVILSVQPIRFPLTGIGRYTYELARNLGAIEGIEDVKYISGETYLDHLPTSEDQEKNTDGDISRLDRLKRFIARSETAVDIYRLLKARKSSTVFSGMEGHVFHGPNFYVPKFPGPTVATFHDLSVLTMPQFHPKERVHYLGKEIRSALKRCTMIATDSDYIKDEIVSFLGVPESKVAVAKLACGDEFRPRSQEDTRTVLQEYGLAHGGYTLYAGTIEPRKNLSALIEAYGRLPNALRTNCPLVLAGYKGWNNAVIMDKIDKGQREGWVKYLGFVPNSSLPILFSGAKLFSFPSLYEGFGLPVLEAMASGVPVLASTRSSLPEVGGDAALYAEPDDVTGMTDLLEKALSDDPWRHFAKAEGLNQAQKFSWQRCAQDTASIYRTALNGWQQ